MPDLQLAFLSIFGFFALMIVCVILAMWMTSRW